MESGRGGDGCVSFRREKYVPRGGPDGGDGGRGGDVVLEVDPGKRTLLDFYYQTRFAADRGRHGSGGRKSGRDGGEKIVSVPPGTMVFDADTDEMLADLVCDGERFVVARGGRGGAGNASFATSTNRSPRRAGVGGPAQAREIRLELKLLADAGLVGLPNAGKSTLLSRISAARPRIAAYPFTTLTPNLGLVRSGDFRNFLLADIPGLIEGASEGKGLGFDFLRHIERCRVLIYLIDATSEDPIGDLKILENELALYSAELLERRRIVVWNKIDALAETAPVVEPPGEVWRISAVSGEGLDGLVHKIDSLIAEEEDDGRNEKGDEW